MEIVLVGSQTGSKEDYQQLQEICARSTVIVNDTNPLELAICGHTGADLLIGGVKKRPLAYKLGQRSVITT
jgi:nitrogenase molybdenum-cofactor synthesis protein NifE